VKVDFNSWLDRVESILNQFGRDMGSETKSSTWVKTALKWIGKATQTEKVIEVISTAKEIYDTLEKDSKSVSDFTNEIVQRHNATRRKLENEDQSLPVFKQIAARMAEEKTQYPTATADRQVFRQQARKEVLDALQNLPSEETFLQDLILDWIRSSEDSYDILDHDADAGSMVYKTNVMIDQRDPKYTKYREDDGYMSRYAKSDQHIAYIEDVANPEATIKTLKRAFGPVMYLHALPLPFHLIIRGDVHFIHGKGEYREGMKDWYPFEAHYVKKGKTDWTLQEGHNDPGLLGWWLGNGKKLTINDLQPE
jgi:hypothetical protein